MSKGKVDIQIPRKQYNELAKLADKLGKTVDDLVVEIIIEELKRGDGK